MQKLDDMTTAGYTGLEIDMLSVGDADAILVTGHRGSNVPTHILIDGGRAGNVDTVREFLRARNISHIDHLVNSHPHEDHAEGLEELVQDTSLTFGRAWLHRPDAHLGDAESWGKAVVGAFANTEVVFKKAAGKAVKDIVESIETSDSLERLLAARGIPISEPFSGKRIAFLQICGPTVAYYEELLREFPERLFGSAAQDTIVALSEEVLKGVKAAGAPQLLENPDCGPINNSSTILGVRFDGDLVLLTADAGKQALDRALAEYALDEASWMQVPHHGSRHNITADLMDSFQPTSAFISASGTGDHPFECVVDGLKQRGSRVFSTHYPNGGHLARYFGEHPVRPGYGPATPLRSHALPRTGSPVTGII